MNVLQKLSALPLAVAVALAGTLDGCSPGPVSLGNHPLDSGSGGDLDAQVTPTAGDAYFDPTGRACLADTDCGGGFACAYLRAAMCHATGVCEPVRWNPACSAVTECACDGTLTSGCDLPPGYARKPVAHPGQCEDGGGSDGGPQADASDPTGRACQSDGDCGGGFACAYLVAAMCSATGVCQPTTAPTPLCSSVATCACDGTLTQGCDLPSGYAHKPVRHLGYCDDGGASDGGPDADAADPTGQECLTDNDCAGMFACAYLTAAMCQATGVCQPVHLSQGCSAVTQCACDGTFTSGCDLPPGYAHKPVAHSGACDAGTD